MKKSFSSIFNDASATNNPDSGSLFKFTLKPPIAEIKEVADPTETPGHLFFLPEKLKSCRRCFQSGMETQKLIQPCKCRTPIHIGCLQDVINQNVQDFSISQNMMKCGNCKLFYSIEVKQTFQLKFDKICRFSGLLLIYYFVLILILGGIVGLVIYYTILCGQNVTQAEHHFSSNNNNGNSNNSQKDSNTTSFISKTETKTILILLILLLFVTQLLLLVKFCRSFVVLRKLKIIQYIQEQQKNHRRMISNDSLQNTNRTQVIFLRPSALKKRNQS